MSCSHMCNMCDATLCRRPGYTKLMKNMQNVSLYLKKRIMDLGGCTAHSSSVAHCMLTWLELCAPRSVQCGGPLAVLCSACCHRPFQGGERGRGPASDRFLTDEEG
jgi:hypothetical protein